MATTPGRGRSIVRTVGFSVLALAAVLITVLAAPAAPEPVDTSNFDRQISVALSDYDANNARTQGAPQQEVVNGWITKDLLTVLSQQTNAMLGASQASAADPRIPLLLMLLVLAVALHGLTIPRIEAVATPEPGAGFQARSTTDEAVSSEPTAWSADEGVDAGPGSNAGASENRGTMPPPAG